MGLDSAIADAAKRITHDRRKRKCCTFPRVVCELDENGVVFWGCSKCGTTEGFMSLEQFNSLKERDNR